jgi:hypothetical protein
MPDETIIKNGHLSTDKTMGLDTTPFPNDCTPLNLDEGTDKAIISNGTTIQITGGYPGNAFAHLHIVDAGCAE